MLGFPRMRSRSAHWQFPCCCQREALSQMRCRVSAHAPREGSYARRSVSAKGDCRERARHARGNVLSNRSDVERRIQAAASDRDDVGILSSTSVDECRQPANVRDDARDSGRHSEGAARQRHSGSGRRRDHDAHRREDVGAWRIVFRIDSRGRNDRRVRFPTRHHDGVDGAAPESGKGRSHAGASRTDALGGTTVLPGLSVHRDEQPQGLHVRRSEDLRQPRADVGERLGAGRRGTCRTAAATTTSTSAATAATAAATSSTAASATSAATAATGHDTVGRSRRAVLLRRTLRQGSPRASAGY